MLVVFNLQPIWAVLGKPHQRIMSTYAVYNVSGPNVELLTISTSEFITKKSHETTIGCILTAGKTLHPQISVTWIETLIGLIVFLEGLFYLVALKRSRLNPVWGFPLIGFKSDRRIKNLLWAILRIWSDLKPDWNLNWNEKRRVGAF